MRRFLGLLAALACLAVLVSGEQAVAATVHCGEVITHDASLTSDMSCAGNGIVIGASNVTLDLHGHSITGAGVGTYETGIDVGNRTAGSYRNVVIRDGRVEDFGYGVALQFAGVRIENVAVSDGERGVNAYTSDLVLEKSSVARNRLGVATAKRWLELAEGSVERLEALSGVKLSTRHGQASLE